MIGQVLENRHRVVRKLGEGATGEVWLTRHVTLDRKEALKILRPDLTARQDMVKRLRREARVLNRLQHPNIIDVYDFGQLADGRFYISMEYVDGRPLSAILEMSGALPVPRVLRVLAQLADAVEHAHLHGVIHRDLKPENLVVLETRGEPDFLKIVDFGLGKIVDPEYEESCVLTNQGDLFGTPCYMSPEQWNGVTTDPRTDIYAIGCVAWELLVGETLFSGRPMDLMHKHVTEMPARPSTRRPQAEIPAALDGIILRCLEKAPERRFQSAAELRFALEQLGGTRQSRGSKRSLVGAATDLDIEVDVDLPQPTRGLPLHSILRQLAERVLELGHHDVNLVVALAEARELDDDLQRNDAEAAALDEQLGDLAQAARVQQASLRRALGELYQERTQAVARGDKLLHRLEHQIERMEMRLAAVGTDLEREVKELTDRAVLLAVNRESLLEERVRPAYRKVDELLSSVLPTLAGNPLVKPLHGRLQHLRQNMETLVRAR